MKTIKDLQDRMYNHSDVGFAVQIQDAIKGAITEGKVIPDSFLSSDNLEIIRQQVLKNKHNNLDRWQNSDPMFCLFTALVGKTKNSVEAALQYIERLERENLEKERSALKKVYS